MNRPPPPYDEAKIGSDVVLPVVVTDDAGDPVTINVGASSVTIERHEGTEVVSADEIVAGAEVNEAEYVWDTTGLQPGKYFVEFHIVDSASRDHYLPSIEIKLVQRLAT